MYIYIHTHVYRLPRIILHDASRIKNKKGNAVYKDSIVDVSMQKAESPGRNAQIGRDVDWSVTQITRIVAIGAGNALARIERLAKGVMEFRKLKNDHASLKHPSLVSPCFQLATCSCNSWYQTSYVIHIEEGGGGGRDAPVFVYIMRSPFLESSQLCPSTIIVTLNLVKTALFDKNGKMNQRQARKWNVALVLSKSNPRFENSSDIS